MCFKHNDWGKRFTNRVRWRSRCSKGCAGEALLERRCAWHSTLLRQPSLLRLAWQPSAIAESCAALVMGAASLASASSRPNGVMFEAGCASRDGAIGSVGGYRDLSWPARETSPRAVTEHSTSRHGCCETNRHNFVCQLKIEGDCLRVKDGCVRRTAIIGFTTAAQPIAGKRRSQACGGSRSWRVSGFDSGRKTWELPGDLCLHAMAAHPPH